MVEVRSESTQARAHSVILEALLASGARGPFRRKPPQWGCLTWTSSLRNVHKLQKFTNIQIPLEPQQKASARSKDNYKTSNWYLLKIRRHASAIVSTAMR